MGQKGIWNEPQNNNLILPCEFEQLTFPFLQSDLKEGSIPKHMHSQSSPIYVNAHTNF